MIKKTFQDIIHQLEGGSTLTLNDLYIVARQMYPDTRLQARLDELKGLEGQKANNANLEYLNQLGDEIRQIVIEYVKPFLECSPDEEIEGTMEVTHEMKKTCETCMFLGSHPESTVDRYGNLYCWNWEPWCFRKGEEIYNIQQDGCHLYQYREYGKLVRTYGKNLKQEEEQEDEREEE